MLPHKASVLAGLVLFAFVGQAAAQERVNSKDRVAIVGAGGGLKSGFGIVSTDRIGLGQYEVITDRNITECACLLTRGSPTLTSDRTGYASCLRREGSSGKGFLVRLLNEEGSAEDGPFMLLAACTN